MNRTRDELNYMGCHIHASHILVRLRNSDLLRPKMAMISYGVAQPNHLQYAWPIISSLSLSDSQGSSSVKNVTQYSPQHDDNAEGVETEQQLKILRTLGCTKMQGFLFSPAKPAAEIRQLLAKHGEGVRPAACGTTSSAM